MNPSKPFLILPSFGAAFIIEDGELFSYNLYQEPAADGGGLRIDEREPFPVVPAAFHGAQEDLMEAILVSLLMVEGELASSNDELARHFGIEDESDLNTFVLAGPFEPEDFVAPAPITGEIHVVLPDPAEIEGQTYTFGQN